MGCFLSTNTSKPSKPPPLPTSKSPPPTHPLPEETVKEVLTESQKPNPTRISSPFIKSAPLLTDSYKPHDAVFTALSTDDLTEEVSVHSTFSESVSVTTSVPEKARRKSPARSKNRSFSGEVRQREMTPVRSSEPSPCRVMPGSGPGYGRRRESGESSGRRSRSPVTRLESGSSKMGTGTGRSQSTRKTGKSPGRVGYGSGSGERVRRVGQDGKWPPPTNNELIENPLVSLECFIFL